MKVGTWEERIEGFQSFLGKASRMALYLLILFLLVYGGHRLYHHLREDAVFALKEVEITGCRRLSEGQLLGLLRIGERSDLLTVELGEISKRLQAHPWVEEVKVEKVFPHKISVQIVERKPIAILQMEDPYYLDEKGVIFAPVGERDEYDYPFITGLGRQTLEREPEESKRLIAKVLELLSALRQRRTMPLEEISEIHVEKAFGLQYFTKAEGIEVKMGWDRYGEKLKRLSIIWSDLKRKGIRPLSIDCSDLQRMVVKRGS
jgi:cell division protein FtsQ